MKIENKCEADVVSSVRVSYVEQMCVCGRPCDPAGPALVLAMPLQEFLDSAFGEYARERLEQYREGTYADRD